LRGKIAGVLYDNNCLTLTEIANIIDVSPSKIVYHLNHMIEEKLVIKEQTKYYLSDMFYLTNGMGVVEKIYTACLNVLEMGIEYNGLKDKKMIISVLKLIMEMVESDI